MGFRAKLANQLSPRSVNGAIKELRMAFKAAKRDGALLTIPLSLLIRFALVDQRAAVLGVRSRLMSFA
jgi:hypothetical protein